jgi:hypothetical protein
VGDCPQVEPGKKTRDIAAKHDGFGNDREYRRAKTVVEQSTPDAGDISVSRAAEIAKLPAEEQQEQLKPLPSKAEAIAV